MISLPLGLNLLEQLGVRSFKIVSKFHGFFQSFRVYLELLSQFLGGRIVKEGNVLIEIRHDQFIT
jgi:hypothetical protein